MPESSERDPILQRTPDLPTSADSPGAEGVLNAYVTSSHGKRHRITFDRTRQIFQFFLEDGSLRHNATYRVAELLNATKGRVKLRKGVPRTGDADEASHSTLYFYFAYKKTKSIWRVKEILVVFETPAERDYWHEIIEVTLSRISQRPTRLIIFINPFGGKGKAKKIYDSFVGPLFRLSSIETEVILTQRANHAHDILKEMPADKWKNIEGLISVGGDGLFNELLTSVVVRIQEEAEKDIADKNVDRLVTPPLRFGIIGAGSANSIVSSVHETDDYATAAVHVAIGSECCVDVCTVHEEDQLLRISANAISYGWLGDVLRDSETFRCLGPIRYQYSALRTTIRHPMYRGMISFDISNQESEEVRLPPCTGNCRVCSGEERADYSFHWQSDFTHVICCVIPCVSPFTPYGLAPFAGIGDGSMDLAMVPRISRCHNLQFMRKVAMYGGKGLYKLDPTLTVYRVSRLSFTPASPKDAGVWNLDGEILEQPPINALHFRLHPRLIRYFGRDVAAIDVSKRKILSKRKSSIVYK